MRSANPALNEKTFQMPTAISPDSSDTMTLQGTVSKCFVLVALVFATAIWAWGQVYVAPEMRESGSWGGKGMSSGLVWGSIIVGFIIAMVTVFKKQWAPVTAPMYALVEGVVLGAISATFEMMYPMIAGQAIMATAGVLLALLIVYRSGLIKVTENFRLGVAAATGGVMLIYLVGFIGSFFGWQIPLIHEGGPIGIGFSLIVIGIASMNLVMDFDFIENASDKGLPKYMEWYAAFGLLVTLIWLYLEILRLLAKMRSR